MSSKKAKQFAMTVGKNPRNKGVARSSNRLFGVKKRENPDHWKSIPRPERRGHDLSQDQIDSAARTIYVMKEENEDKVFEKTSRYLDIGTKTLYKIWHDFMRDGKVPTHRFCEFFGTEFFSQLLRYEY